MNLETHPMSPTHPGSITFFEGDKETVEKAQDVPESIRFAPDKDGQLQPVVKIVALTEGDRRIIREYGVDGTELRATVQVRLPKK